MKKHGFTLIELLIVIMIVGILLAFVVSNFTGARSRATDAKKKGNLKDLQYALQLYANNYGRYPTGSNGIYINGCGTNGTTRCPVCSTADFASGGTDGCSFIYAQVLSRSDFRYYSCADGDTYRLKINLDNASDPEIVESQAKCPVDCGTTYGSTDYVLCAE